MIIKLVTFVSSFIIFDGKFYTKCYAAENFYDIFVNYVIKLGDRVLSKWRRHLSILIFCTNYPKDALAS